MLTGVFLKRCRLSFWNYTYARNTTVPLASKRGEQRCCGGRFRFALSLQMEIIKTKNPHMTSLSHGERMRKIYNLFLVLYWLTLSQARLSQILLDINFRYAQVLCVRQCLIKQACHTFSNGTFATRKCFAFGSD